MAEGGVGVKTNDMRAAATAIRDQAALFKTETDAIMTALNTDISGTDESAGWYGPNAGAFIAEVSKKQTDFDNACGNFNNQADNLDEQAGAWDAYEAG